MLAAIFDRMGKQQNVAFALMIALSVKVRNVFGERSPQGALTEQNQLGQAFLFDRFYPALGVGVQVRASRGYGERVDMTRVDDRAEGTRVFRVPIMQKVATVLQDTPFLHRYIPGYLLHPSLIGVNGDAGDVHPSGLEVDEEENVVGHQPAQREHLHTEEIGSCQYRQVRSDERCPRGRALPLRGRRYAVAPQNIADGLV